MKDKGSRENRIKNTSLIGLFGRDTFATLQKKLAQATDFSFSTIDYRGGEIAGHCYQKGYENFLKEMESEVTCQMNSAFAAAKAAITNIPYIYLCQCGLVKIAVPIVVNEQYLGAVICGDVRCEDIDYVDPETGFPIVQKDFPLEKNPEKEQIISMMPSYSAVKIKAVADLVFFVVNEMCQKENYALKLASEEHNQVHLKDIRNKNEELKKNIRLLEQDALKAKLYPQTLLNMLATVSSMSMLEDSTLTQEVTDTFCEMLRYYVEYTRDNISLDKELTQINKYFEVLRLRYESRIQLESKIDADVKYQMIPKLVLFPLVQYIINLGILNQNFKGTLSNSVDFISGRCIISFDLKHDSDAKSKMGYFKEAGNVIDERFYLEQMIVLEERLKLEYKDDFKLSVELEHIVLDIPQTVNKA